MAGGKEKKEGDSGPKKNKTMLFVGIAVVVLIIGVGAGAYMLGAKNATAVAAGSKEENVTPEETTEDENQIGPMVKIDNFVVNLLDKGDIHYLKVSISLEVESAEVEEEVKNRMSQLRDLILLHTGNKSLDELADLQGKLQLRAELLAKINDILRQGRVKRVYFTNFVIQ
jgi:flagellar FliL protein